MKILMFTQKAAPSDPILGFAAAWIKALAARVERLTVVTLYQERGVDWPANVTIHSLGKDLSYNRWRRLGRLLKIAPSLVQECDLVFCHMSPKYLLALSPWAKIYRRPLTLWYAHGQSSINLRLALKVASQVFTPTSESFPLISNKVVCLGHGIPTETFNFPQRAKAEADLKIVCIGRLSPRKDQMTFLVAAREIVSQKLIKNPRFYLIGSPLNDRDAVYYAELQKYCAQNSLSDYVEFVPALSPKNLLAWYQRGDIFVNTSKTGSLDKVILEAMAAQKPVFTSNAAGVALLRPLNSLLTFNPGDFRQLSRNLLAWLNLDIADREKIQRQLRANVLAHHDLEKLAAALVSHFQALLEKS